MMRKFQFRKIFLLGFSLFLFSCTSVDTQDEESMMNLDEGMASVDAGASDALGAEDFSMDFDESGFDEAASDSTAPPTDDFSADGFSDEDFSGFESESGGEFSDQAFADESFDDFASEPLAEQAPPAPQENFDESFEPFEPQVPTEEEFAGPLAAPIETAPPIESAQPPLEEPVYSPPVSEVPISGATAQITDIRYDANSGAGNLIIEGDSPLNYQTRLNSDTNQFVIEIPGANLPSRLKRPFIMKDFPNAQIGAVNAYQKPGSTTARIVVQLKNSSIGEPLVTVSGNSLTVSPEASMIANVSEQDEGEIGGAEVIVPDYGSQSGDDNSKVLGAKTLDQFLMGNNKFYGRPISIQIKDADIRDVINFIADESGTNLVLSEDVDGKVTLKLRQVPWDQALVTVMQANKLGYVRQGNVIRISKLDTLKQESEAAKSVAEAQKTLSPVRVKVIPVSFANVTTLVDQFKPFLTKDSGSIIADNRTSSLIVTDSDEVLERVSRLVRALDIPPAQVMIEGKVVEAGEEFIQSAGVNWNFGGSEVNIGQGRFGPVELTPSLNIGTRNPQLAAGDAFNFGLNIGTMDVLGDLSATLALAERDSLLKIISSPRIVAMNREKATIKQQGEQVTISSVVDQQGNMTTGVQRTPIVVELTVTPQVTNDGNVIMDVQVLREFAGALLDGASNARPINRRSAVTKILVRNGQTAVIGGIYQSDSTEVENGVPVLKDLPVLGWLFKSKSRDSVKNELLIFLTPRILNNQDEPTTLTSSGLEPMNM